MKATSIRFMTTVAATCLIAGSALAQGTLNVAVQGTPANKRAMEAILPDFEAQTGTSVEVEYIGGNYGAVITTRLQGSNAPDMMTLVPGGATPFSVFNMAEAGRLADLSGAAFVDRIAEDTMPLVATDGAVYAWPATVQVSGLIVNEDILAENDLSVPTTQDELFALCGALRDKGITPFAWSGTPESRSAGQATTVAGSVGAASVEVNAPINAAEANYADSAEWRGVVETISQMVEAGCLDPDSATMSDGQAAGMMLRGAAAMMMNSTQMLGYILASDETGSLNLKVHAFPGVAAEDTTVLITPYDAFAVSAVSENKEAAIAFLDYLSQPEVQRVIAGALGNIAPVDAAEATLPETLMPLAPYFETDRVQVNPVMSWRGGRVYLTMSRGVQGLLTGQLTPDTVLADMDAANRDR